MPCPSVYSQGFLSPDGIGHPRAGLASPSPAGSDPLLWPDQESPSVPPLP